MDIWSLFGRNLRRHRLAAGLRQEAVAERMGVDRAHVSSMERGLQNVTLSTLWQAAQALNVRATDLVDESGDQPAPSKERVARRGPTKPPG